MKSEEKLKIPGEILRIVTKIDVFQIKKKN